MNTQEQFLEWVAEVSRLDITKEADLLALFRKLTDLNRITQRAEREQR